MSTITLTPSTYYVSSTYVRVTNDSNMYTDTSSTTYGTFTHNRSITTAYGAYLRGFNFSDIPNDAVVKSFSIKIKARENGLVITSAYAPKIANDTTVLSGSFDSLSTSTQTLTCKNVTEDFDTIRSYGSDFSIRFALKRSANDTSGYVRVYGAEILVELADPVTISFNANGGTGTMSDVTDYVEGSNYILPPCSFTAPNGRSFDGWQVGTERYEIGDSITLSGDTVITALWTYLVNFDSNGGSGVMNNVSVSRDDTYLLPSCTFTPPSGRDFDGWEVNGIRKLAGIGITLVADITIYALWTYLVNFNSNGGTGTMLSDSVSRDDTYYLPSCSFTAPVNRNFDGWSYNNTRYNINDEIEVLNDITVSTLWTYIISFDSNGGSGNMNISSLSRDNLTYQLPNCTFTPPFGGIFEKWKYNNVDYYYQDYVELSGDTIFIAQWHYPTLYIKDNNIWKEIDMGYEKINNEWNRKTLSELFKAGYGYRKGDI